MNKEELTQVVTTWHQEKRKIVLVTGVFDILHHAHEMFLQKAKAAGDVLIVGLESDVRVKKMKGEGRPINTAQTRMNNLEKLGIATHIFILPETFNKREDYLGLLQLIKPAVLAVSAHTPHQDSKSELMKEIGGELKVVMAEDTSISTTKMLNGKVA